MKLYVEGKLDLTTFIHFQVLLVPLFDGSFEGQQRRRTGTLSKLFVHTITTS